VEAEAEVEAEVDAEAELPHSLEMQWVEAKADVDAEVEAEAELGDRVPVDALPGARGGGGVRT